MTRVRPVYNLSYNTPNRSQAAMNFRTGTERGQPCPQVLYRDPVTMESVTQC
jgi:hypothetical protein